MCPSIACNNYNEAIVIWEYNGNVLGLRIDENLNHIDDDPIEIYDNAFSPDVAYDSAFNSYMIVVERPTAQAKNDIAGALVYGTDPYMHRFTVSQAPNRYHNETKPIIRYNKAKYSYISVWHHLYAINDMDIHGRIIDLVGRLQ